MGTAYDLFIFTEKMEVHSASWVSGVRVGLPANTAVIPLKGISNQLTRATAARIETNKPGSRLDSEPCGNSRIHRATPDFQPRWKGVLALLR